MARKELYNRVCEEFGFFDRNEVCRVRRHRDFPPWNCSEGGNLATDERSLKPKFLYERNVGYIAGVEPICRFIRSDVPATVGHDHAVVLRQAGDDTAPCPSAGRAARRIPRNRCSGHWPSRMYPQADLPCRTGPLALLFRRVDNRQLPESIARWRCSTPPLPYG